MSWLSVGLGDEKVWLDEEDDRMVVGIEKLVCQKCGKTTQHGVVEYSTWKVLVCSLCRLISKQG